MIGFLKQFITKAVNVHPAEIFDVTICWLVSFFVRAAFVIAWTVLVVEFIQYFGISSIAFLFLAHGLTSILGYLLYRVPINRYKPISLLIFSVFATVTFALLAFFSFDVNSYVYITSLLFIVSLFLSQIKIAKLLFVESLFTPTQSTRVFPVIESADTVALIFAGFIVSLVSAYLPLNSLLLVLSFFVLFILPVLSYFTSSSIKHPLTLLINKTHNNTSDTIALSHLFSSKLLLAISAIVFFQFAYFGLLEVQYLFQVFNFSDSVSGHASNLAFDLGMLHIFFGFFTFLFQALLASRVLMFSGVIKSMLVCPLVLVSSTFLMLFSPGLALVLINKFNFEISNVLHTNAYHGVFYIFSHSSRAKILEFLEGFIRPLALVVTSVFLILSFNFVNFTLLNILSILILIGSIYSISKFDNSYNFVPRMHLKTSDDPKVILNALSILQQNRSSSNADYLLSIINAKGFTEPIVLKKVFDIISNQADYLLVPDLINLANTQSVDIHYILPTLNKILLKYSSEIAELPFTNREIQKLYKNLSTQELDSITRGELLSFILLSDLTINLDLDLGQLLKMYLDEDNIHIVYPVLLSFNDPSLANVLTELINEDTPRLNYYILRVLSNFDCSKQANKLIEFMSQASMQNKRFLLLFAMLNQNSTISVPHDIFAYFNDSTKGVIERLCYQLYLYKKAKPNHFLSLLYERFSQKELIFIRSLVLDLSDEKLLDLINQRLKFEVHLLYSELESTHSKNSDNKLLCSQISELYNFLGASKEYFTVLDLLRKY